ncbi:MarR family winged helix-turn-helix transcriptional regulator [Pseudonocardia broussonetiae]|uniref:Winged helix-turn-helix transcriptional regulator n=1 Tax=Pseudonocardia broussonetiae TaxID=2736640 RepID=A0A6M6JUS1_9PSEU|nr:MarR family winged helix-turn-helix transcriptional regulator [Pseudonocardia broussonetiae]QJY51165.1 winged helix-turn-helix transcriptional regulator [Pseudonocardia broussonetiae]
MSAELRVIDDALVRLRRLWSAAPRRVGDATPVEMSSVLVVEACARGADAGQEVSVGEVARFADVEHSTASRLVDRAARSGLVERTPSAHDSRRTALALTPSGRELRERAVAFRTSWLAGILTGWDDADVHSLATLLDRFAALAVERGGPGTPDRQ